MDALGGIGLAAVALLIGALVLRLRAAEPPAVARVADRVAEVRAELATLEARVAEMRAELARAEVTLAPARVEREAHEAAAAAAEVEADRAEGRLARLRAEIEAAEQELAAQQARRAEAEAALRTARQQLHAVRTGADAAPPAAAPDVSSEVPPDVAPAAATHDRRIDTVLAAGGTDPAEEPPIATTGGAVRPTAALPPEADVLVGEEGP